MKEGKSSRNSVDKAVRQGKVGVFKDILPAISSISIIDKVIS